MIERLPSLPFDEFALSELHQTPHELPDTVGHPYDTSVRMRHAQLPDYGPYILDVRHLKTGGLAPTLDQIPDGTILRGTFRMLAGSDPEQHASYLEATSELQVSNQLFATDILTLMPHFPDSKIDRRLSGGLATWRGLLGIVADVEVAYLRLPNGAIHSVGQIREVYAAELPFGHPTKAKTRPEQNIIVSGMVAEYNDDTIKLTALSPNSPETIEHVIDVGSGIMLQQAEFLDHLKPVRGDIVHVRAYQRADGSLGTSVSPGMISTAIRDHRISQVHVLKGSEERITLGLDRLLDFDASIAALRTAQNPREFRKIYGELLASRFDPAIARMGGRGYHFSRVEADALADINKNYWPKKGAPLALLVEAASYQAMRASFDVNLYALSWNEFYTLFDRVMDGALQPKTKNNGVFSLFATFDQLFPYGLSKRVNNLFSNTRRMNALLERVETDSPDNINTTIAAQLLSRTSQIIRMDSKDKGRIAHDVIQIYHQVIDSLSSGRLKNSGLGRIIAAEGSKIMRAAAGLEAHHRPEQLETLKNPEQCRAIAKELPPVLDRLRNLYPPASDIDKGTETTLDIEVLERELENETSKQIARNIADAEMLIARSRAILGAQPHRTN